MISNKKYFFIFYDNTQRYMGKPGLEITTTTVPGNGARNAC
jgi:hypothetical protein